MKRVLVVLVLAGALVNAQTYTSGDWEYTVENGEATITGYTGSGGAVTIPSEVNGVAVKQVGVLGTAFGPPTNLDITNITIPDGVTRIGEEAFAECSSLTSITIPNSVTSIGPWAFFGCTSLSNVTMPDRFIGQISRIGLDHGQAATDYLINALASNSNFVSALATNDVFVTAVANKILAASNNYGLATQTGVSSTITATTSNLATKAELTASLAQSRTDGINSVLSNPNLWTLYTTNQISAMAIGDLVLTRTNNGSFVLNYDIEQSEDLVNWYPYQGFAMPLTNLPTNKAFVRIKAKQ